MFKPDVKKQVFLKFRELFGTKYEPEIVGTRTSPSKLYYVTLRIGPTLVADALHRDWRKAYKLLKGEVEKLYVEGYVPPVGK
ncbi:MAG: hypothetical protein EBU83_04510 [bacterium]|nr:hypothetical protein [Candidatus Aquidulcis sp.]